MTISLSCALHSIKEDEGWKKKVIIGGVVYIFLSVAYALLGKMPSSNISLFVVAAIVYLFCTIYYGGFFALTGNKDLNGGSNQMAEWDEPNILVAGIKYVLSSFLTFFLFSIMFFLCTLVCGIICGIIFGLIYRLFSIITGQGTELLGLLSTILGFCFSIIIGLFASQFIFTIITSYLKNLRLSDMLSFKKHYAIIKENQHAIWTLIGKNILCALLFALIIVVLSVTIAGIIFVPFVMFVGSMAALNLLVQYGRQIEIGKYFN